MSVVCLAFIDFFDDQHRTFTLEYYVPPPADMGPGVDLPTTAHQLAVINALIASDHTGLSEARVRAYGLKVIEEDMAGVHQGSGAIAIPIVLKTRSGVDAVGRTDPFGDLEGIEFKIPAVNQSNVQFNPADRNQISTSTDIWTPLRDALHNIGWRDHDGTGLAEGQMFETASLFNGKRQLMRPK